MSFSIMQDKKECFVCRSTYGLHLHHIFEGTANRKQSDKFGCTIWLCGYHHNLSSEGIHFNKALDLKVKKLAQQKFSEVYDDDFIKTFGKSYL